LDVSFCKSTDGPPTLDDLLHFPVTNGHIDLPEKIGADYVKFGILLLEDKNGHEVKGIEASKRFVPVDITVEILRYWLKGKGRKPVTWQTLVECLRYTGLNVLADEIENSISSHSVTTDSNLLLSDLPQEGRKNVQQ